MALRLTYSIVLMASLLCLNQHCAAADETKRPFAETYFRLPSVEGELVEIFADSQTNYTVVCFLGTECPLAKLYAPKLNRLAETYSGEGVQFIGINSNLHDSMEEVRKFTRAHQLMFPMLKDAGNKVADAYQVARTSEVFVIDSMFRIRYQGRIDDQYQPGLTKPTATRHDLKQALDELLSGQTVSVPKTEPVGCLIGRVPHEEVETKYTFGGEVSMILSKHCVECHQSGEIGPFALTDYDEVIGWGEMLIEVIDEGRMPPWHADPTIGHFSNSRDMPEAEKEILRQWVAGGMPKGDLDQIAPVQKRDSDWLLPRQPDLVLEMNRKPFQVPAEGVIEYQYYVVDPKFEEDTWVTGAQVIPGNRSVVHHCIVFIRPPDGSRFKGTGWLAGYVPGQDPLPVLPGHGKLIPAGSKLVFQMHYTPTGTPEEDVTKIGLMLGKPTEMTHEVYTLIGINHNFEIPPNVRNYEVHGQVDRLPPSAKLMAMTPHMHLRGKSFDVSLKLNGEERPLLSVPHYDFNWQHFYVLDEPVSLQNVEQLQFTATFDNSEHNPVNPDPNDYISWGDQTWQEMAIVFFAIAEPIQDKRNRESSRSSTKSVASGSDSAVQEFVDDFFSRFDRNGNGEIVKEELPTAMRAYGFNRLNRNGDDHLDKQEIRHLAKRKLK